MCLWRHQRQTAFDLASVHQIYLHLNYFANNNKRQWYLWKRFNYARSFIVINLIIINIISWTSFNTICIPIYLQCIDRQSVSHGIGFSVRLNNPLLCNKTLFICTKSTITFRKLATSSLSLSVTLSLHIIHHQTTTICLSICPFFWSSRARSD